MYTVSDCYVDHVEFERLPDREDIIGLKSEISVIEEELAACHEDIYKSAKLESAFEKIQRELKKRNAAQCFKLSPQSSTCVVREKIHDFASKEEELKYDMMTQLPVNMNDATTGHKLQGMSKDKLIVVS